VVVRKTDFGTERRNEWISEVRRLIAAREPRAGARR
jgi:hypothetical protein